VAFRKSPSRHPSPSSSFRRVRPQVEALESRIVPYALTGNAWPHPQLVTISFMPDGTIDGVTSSGYAYSNMFQKMDARFGSAAAWEGIIEQAAQTWAAVTNINFQVVSDNGTPIGQGAYQQGDPNMGDIRIGGYSFGNGYLATTEYPPPANDYSVAGDIQFNTAVSWHSGSTYDLFTVALHEIGHALGLGHSAYSTAVMYANYTGIKQQLTADDINGVQAIYGTGRTPDAYNIGGASDGTENSAANLTSLIDPTSLTALVTNLDLTSASQAEWYTFTAPTTTSGTLTVDVQSSGLSLLTPQATLYASDGSTVLATASGAGATDGSTLTLTTANVTPGEKFYVKVVAATNNVFGTGTYALTLNFGTGASPTVPLPNTATPNGSNPSAGGAAHETADSFGAQDPFVPLPATPMPTTTPPVPVFLNTAVPATPSSEFLLTRLDVAAPLRGPLLLGQELTSPPPVSDGVQQEEVTPPLPVEAAPSLPAQRADPTDLVTVPAKPWTEAAAAVFATLDDDTPPAATTEATVAVPPVTRDLRFAVLGGFMLGASVPAQKEESEKRKQR
jgi:hypothetical protein